MHETSGRGAPERSAFLLFCLVLRQLASPSVWRRRWRCRGLRDQRAVDGGHLDDSVAKPHARPSSLLHFVEQLAQDVGLLLVPILAERFPERDQAQQFGSGVSKKAPRTFSGAPERAVVALLKPQIVALFS